MLGRGGTSELIGDQRVPPSVSPNLNMDPGVVMREHRYSFEMPHSTARIWALFQDYDR